MGIPRKDLVRKRRIRRIAYSVASAAAMGVITFGLSRLEPMAPTVDGSPFIDTVQRGDMVLDVRGLGTLVPENVLLVPARDQGRIERRFLLPGEQVEAHTVLFQLSNPQLEQDVFDTESEIRAAEAEYADLKLSREGRRYVMRNHEWRDSSSRLEESLMDLVSTASVGPLADKI